ncbi:WD repeat-containing protein 55 [Tanacetum coccineum]|uniref:WD repeat-containing protein 55 n=1 Tax=Tanacetum coccineum TaxID=301880 RepID=A0ABQ5AC26_9ASTR
MVGSENRRNIPDGMITLTLKCSNYTSTVFATWILFIHSSSPLITPRTSTNSLVLISRWRLDILAISHEFGDLRASQKHFLTLPFFVISASLKVIVTGSPDCSILATDIETRSPVARLENCHKNAVNRLVNLTESTITFGGDDGCIKAADAIFSAEPWTTLCTAKTILQVVSYAVRVDRREWDYTGLTVAIKTLNHDGLQGHKEWLAKLSCLMEEQLLEAALNLTVHCCGCEFRVLNCYDQRSLLVHHIRIP